MDPKKILPFFSFLSGHLVLDNEIALADDKKERWLRYGELRQGLQERLTLWPDATQGASKELILAALPPTIPGAMAYLSAVGAGHAVLLVDPGASRLDLFIAAYAPDAILLPSALRPGEDYSPADWPADDGFFLWRRTTKLEARPHPDLFLMLRPPGPQESIKTVRLSYDNVRSNLAATLEALPFTKETRALLPMPLAYSFTLSVLHMILSVGGKAILTEHDIKNRDLWQLAQNREANMLAGVPFHYEYLARAGIDNLHVPRIKTFLQSGGRMPIERTRELMRQFAQRDGKLFILYGQTEAAPRMAILPLHDKPEKIGSMGRVIDGGRLWIENGEVLYAGPNVMMGYAQGRADSALGTTHGSVLRTGDTGTIDEDGFVFVG